MGRTIALLMVLLMASAGASAQTFSEWFRQRKTRMKYLRLQVAALARLERLVQDGYEAAEEDIDVVKYIRGREYAQHFRFFQSLVEVNPGLAASPLMKSYLDKEQYLLGQLDEWLGGLLDNDGVLPSETALAGYVVRDITHDIGALDRLMELLIKPKAFSMTDGERIREMADLFRRVGKEYERTVLSMRHINSYIELRRKMQTDNDYLKIMLQ